MILVFLMGLTTAGFGQSQWKKEVLQLPFPICYASDESHDSYVAPPQEYFNRLKSASTQKAKIEVTYVGFSLEAQQAFQFAVQIWENLIYSPVPIRMKATWKSLEKGVLGSCGPTAYYRNFNSTQKWNCYYPVAIVEKMLGEEVNSPSQYDLEASFNKDFANWYLGVDGKTPSGQYDFVSVVLHELAHGLGFTGLFYTFEGKGAYSYSSESYAGIFDQFVINKAGESLVNKSIFTNPSVNLYQAMTSGWLDFNTRLSGSQLPHLFAPSTWDEGSSIYHLDEVTYPGENINSLMTPYTGTGEAIHSPGPHSLDMLYDMGWKTTTIKHQPLKDIEFASAPIAFNASIESDHELDSSKLYLVYSVNRFLKKDSLLLTATAIPENFTASISQFKTGEFNYFFSATDQRGQRFVFPSNAPARYLGFKIGVDNVDPIVIHEPLKYLLSSNPTAKIEAEVTDNLGIASVRIEYFVPFGNLQSIPLLKTGEDIYSGEFKFPVGTIKGGDKINYRIVALDGASQFNTGRSPVTGYHTFTVETIRAAGEKYVNDFNNITDDFIGSDFKVLTPTGFDNPGLNTAHPYVSPNMDDMNFNFTAILRNPIVLKVGGKMSYDEVVLVEPGEEGAVFGGEDYYDYVIVEGSNDGGISWKPLLNGYDSYAQESWNNLYNSSISVNNSSAIPTKDMFVKREFELLSNGNFKAGDTILVRFRLFSDPYSNGWGWIIDNLNIQEYFTDLQVLSISSGEIVFFPNPATEKLNIQFQTKSIAGKVNLKAFNSTGAMIYNQLLSIGTTAFQTDIDVSGFKPGLYLFSVEPEKGRVITRKILVQ